MNVHLELLHGAENAFGLLDDREQGVRGDSDYAGIARALNDTDGLLVLLRPTTTETYVCMRMFNPDGSEAEMCGNGIRCVVRYLAERGEGAHFAIQTAAGTIRSSVVSRNPYSVATQLGVPSVGMGRALERPGKRWRYIPVSVGNPHAVVFVEDISKIDLERYGPMISTDPEFPGGTNVHFVQVTGPDSLRVVHWERGAGATRACGTGIVASAAAAIIHRGVESPVNVSVPGGELVVEWDRRGGAILTGPVEHTGARDLVLT